MTRIEDGIQDTEPIRFLELLGLDEEDLAGYSIRLNGSNPEWGKWSDLPDAYYSSYDDLMKWIFTKKWPDKDKATAQIHTRKVLQFIQLKPENPHPTQWLFVGAYDVLDEYTENDGKILYRYNEIPEYASLKARAVVYYKRDPGYTGVVFNLSNNEERRRDFLKTMTLEKIAQSPVSALPFPGYENVRLTHRQLVAAVNNEEWRTALGSVQAVYLQTNGMALRGVRLLTERSLARSAVALEGIRVRRPLRGKQAAQKPRRRIHREELPVLDPGDLRHEQVTQRDHRPRTLVDGHPRIRP